MQKFAFPFYPAKNKQFRFDPRNTQGADYRVNMPNNRFVPWLIKQDASGEKIDCVKVYSLANEAEPILVLQPSALNYKMYTDATSDYWIYFGAIVPGLNLPCGKYYLQVNRFFSEVFFVADVSKMIEVNWRHTANIGADLIYQNGFFQQAFLDTALLEPKYLVEEEGDVNGFGVFIQTFGRAVKQLALEAPEVPEFLVDALSLIRIHNTVNIGGYQNVKEVKVDPAWESSGVMATVKILFSEEAPVISKKCDNLLLLTETDTSGETGGCLPSTSPIWSNTGEFECLTDGSGNKLLRQVDTNPESASFNQLRWSDPVYDPMNCEVANPATLYKSAEISELINKNDCADPSMEGSFVLYTVPFGYGESTISQAAADQIAMDYFNATKQDYANANGQCLVTEQRIFLDVFPTAGSYENYYVIARRTGNLDPEVLVHYRIEFAGIGDQEGQAPVTVRGTLTIPAGLASNAAGDESGSGSYAYVINRYVTQTFPGGYAF